MEDELVVNHNEISRACYSKVGLSQKAGCLHGTRDKGSLCMGIQPRRNQWDNHTLMDSEAVRRNVNTDRFATTRKKEKP